MGAEMRRLRLTKLLLAVLWMVITASDARNDDYLPEGIAADRTKRDLDDDSLFDDQSAAAAEVIRNFGKKTRNNTADYSDAEKEQTNEKKSRVRAPVLRNRNFQGSASTTQLTPVDHEVSSAITESSKINFPTLYSQRGRNNRKSSESLSSQSAPTESNGEAQTTSVAKHFPSLNSQKSRNRGNALSSLRSTSSLDLQTTTSSIPSNEAAAHSSLPKLGNRSNVLSGLTRKPLKKLLTTSPISNRESNVQEDQESVTEAVTISTSLSTEPSTQKIRSFLNPSGVSRKPLKKLFITPVSTSKRETTLSDTEQESITDLPVTEAYVQQNEPVTNTNSNLNKNRLNVLSAIGRKPLKKLFLSPSNSNNKDSSVTNITQEVEGESLTNAASNNANESISSSPSQKIRSQINVLSALGRKPLVKLNSKSSNHQIQETSPGPNENDPAEEILANASPTNEKISSTNQKRIANRSKISLNSIRSNNNSSNTPNHTLKSSRFPASRKITDSRKKNSNSFESSTTSSAIKNTETSKSVNKFNGIKNKNFSNTNENGVSESSSASLKHRVVDLKKRKILPNSNLQNLRVGNSKNKAAAENVSLTDSFNSEPKISNTNFTESGNSENIYSKTDNSTTESSLLPSTYSVVENTNETIQLEQSELITQFPTDATLEDEPTIITDNFYYPEKRENLNEANSSGIENEISNILLESYLNKMLLMDKRFQINNKNFNNENSSDLLNSRYQTNYDIEVGNQDKYYLNVEAETKSPLLESVNGAQSSWGRIEDLRYNPRQLNERLKPRSFSYDPLTDKVANSYTALPLISQAEENKYDYINNKGNDETISPSHSYQALDDPEILSVIPLFFKPSVYVNKQVINSTPNYTLQDIQPTLASSLLSTLKTPVTQQVELSKVGSKTQKLSKPPNSQVTFNIPQLEPSEIGTKTQKLTKFQTNQATLLNDHKNTPELKKIKPTKVSRTKINTSMHTRIQSEPKQKIIPTPSTTIIYTESVVTTTRLKTYTYVVTKHNGQVTEITSSTAVKPKISSLTITVPITLTVTPTVVPTSIQASSTVGEYFLDTRKNF